MSIFKNIMVADIHHIFLNASEFAEKRTIRYDGDTYADIPIVFSGLEERDRNQLKRDHAHGLFLVSAILHCAVSDLNGKQPEKGMRISINDREGGGGFFREFHVASSSCEMGMLDIELEAIDE